MKDFFKNVLKTPMVLVFAFVVLFYGVGAIAAPAEINRFAIVTAIGIDPVDGEDNEIELSLLTFTPVAQQTFTENYNVILSKGRSISEALDFAGLHIGRQVGLSHVRNVIINQELLKEDVTKYLDYLSRSKTFELSANLIVTDSKASEFLQAVKALDSESSIKIGELMTYNKDYIYATEATFETFFKGLFSPTKVSVLPVVSMSDEGEGVAIETQGPASEVGSDPKSSDSSSGQSNSQQKNINNDGRTAVFKDGRLATILDSRDIKKIKLINGGFNNGSLVVEHFSDEIFDDAELTFEILGRGSSFKVIFENNIPIFIINANMTMALSEVQNKDGLIQKNVEFFNISEGLKNEIELKLKTSIAEGIEIMRENQVDIVDFYSVLYNSDKKGFLKYLDSLEDKEDYLNGIVFKFGVHIFTK